MDDKIVRQHILDELDYDPSFNAANVGVAVAGGVVTLTGHVNSYAEKMAIERAVQRIRGVRAVAQEVQVRDASARQTSDDQIAKRALSIIDWYAQVPKDGVLVRVQNGWITLSGAVEWQFQRTGAEVAVRKLSGVVGVTNLIEVRPTIRAENVKAKIMEALKRSAELEADAITVKVSEGKVTLEGRIKAWHEREIAERAAWSAPGVSAVEDRLNLV